MLWGIEILIVVTPCLYNNGTPPSDFCDTMSNPPFGASYVDGFSDYIVSTYETPVVYIVIVCLLVTFSIVIVAPIACLGQDLARRNKVADDSTYNNKHATHPSDNNNGITLPHHNHGNTTATTASSVVDSNPLSPHSTSTTVSHNHDLKESVFHKIEYPQQHRQHPPAPEQYRAPHNVADIRIFHGELLAAMKVMATERRFASQPQMCHASSGTAQPQQYPASYPQIFPSTPRFFDRSGSFNFKHNSKNNHQTNSERLSAIPSVATTSRLHIPRPRPHNHSGGADKKRPLRSRMPWSHNRPIPRTDTIQRSVWKERQSQMMNHQGNLLSASGDHYNNNNNNNLDGNGSISQNDGGGSRFSRSSWGADGQAIALRKPRAISGAAGTYLDDEAVDGEFEFYRKRYLEQHHQVQKARQHQQKATRTPSISGNSFSDMGSVMPPLSSSVLAPHDAADANDPGRIPNPMKYRSTTISPTGEYMKVSGDSLSSHLSTALSHLIDLAEHNYESQRIVSLAIVPTISAMAEPLFRMVLVAIISNYIDTDSMVAYVLVILFIRITTMEISGAISDAESNMLQDAFIVHGSGDIGFYHAGQTMQLAIFFQLVIGLPVLLMWYFTMDDVVQWLVDDSRIADIASTYSGVIIIDYLVRSASRSFMLPFHLLGHGHFEKYVDIIATILTVVAIAIVAASNDLSLTAIGWIQVIIGIAKFSTKVAYVVLRGWFAPYRDGLLKSWACKVCWIECLSLSSLDCIKTNVFCPCFIDFATIEYWIRCGVLIASLPFVSWFTARTGRMGGINLLR